jgi:hypothetical protein
MAKYRLLHEKSRTGHRSHRGCMEEKYELLISLLNKARNIWGTLPKFTINHECLADMLISIKVAEQTRTEHKRGFKGARLDERRR